MKKIKLVETFEGTPSVSLKCDSTNVNETMSDSRVDGKYIIGMIEGQFFKPDGMSRNGRWYPRSLWEKVLNKADVKNRFNTSTMFGEIGHSDGPVEDLTLRTGCASHFIDRLWITEDGHGMGRAYILNTPTGQLLKTYLGAGCKLKVSTRGEGMYKEGCTHNGCPVVDDDSYELQTADFVINPGFLETSATLKEAYTKSLEVNEEQIQETLAHVRKEGETRMNFDVDAYVRELKAERDSAKAEAKALREELNAKEKELLQKQFNESADVKKLTEELAPFREMKVSAKTLNETLKKSQEAYKKVSSEKAKIAEELSAYQAKCGSLDEVESATKMSVKALAKIQEYQKFGSVEDMKKLAESVSKLLPRLHESKRLERNAKKLFSMVKEQKVLQESVDTALKTVQEYQKLVGTLEEAKKLVETKQQPVATKKPSLKEALALSKKYNCTVESAAKLVKKHGYKKSSEMMESLLKGKKSKKLESSKKLVEEVAQLDKVTNIPAEKTAKDFLTTGIVKNYFNNAALGKEIKPTDINTIDGTQPQKRNAANDLLKKFAGKFETEPAPKGLEKEVTPAQAEAAVKKLLK